MVFNGACRYALLNTDFFFSFTITQRTPYLNVPLCSKYQFFLYETITNQRKKEKTFDQIAEWLNNEGYLTLRGKKFRSGHIHSILKKRLAKEELLNREYPSVWSDFSMEVVDKTILMSDFVISPE